MTQPLGVDDFFILEAGEYLDRLATLAGAPVAPGADELVRFTRALRGSALMANQPAIARSASGLEHMVRSYRDGQRHWEHDVGPLTREAIGTLRTLVARVREWTPEDTARAERLALQLESSAGGGARSAPAAAPAPNETGVRAFLARESAALGSAIDQAARSLTAGQAGSDLLTAVLRRMQPLRGLAALADYPPLPDLLDGIEETLSAVGRLDLTPSDGGERLGAAALALGRGARDIADRGRPDPDAPEFRRFATLLLAPVADTTPVVPIESLFFGGEDGIVQLGVAPRGPVAAAFGAAAIVSRGEHLCQTADEIAEATADAQRDLRFHVLLTDLRTLSNGLPTGLDVAVSAFASSSRGAVTRRAAAADPSRFAGLIRDAGALLRGYSEATDIATLAGAFDGVIAGLDMLGAPAVAPAIAPPAEDVIVPIESLAEEPGVMLDLPDDEDDVVPIESLAPDTDLEPVAAAPAPLKVPVPAAQVDDAGWDLAASWNRYEALVAGLDPMAADEADLVATLETVAVVESVEVIDTVEVIETVEVVTFASPVAIPESEPEPVSMLEHAVVDIEELCYRGHAARERAQEVRRELRLALAANTLPDVVIPMVDELYDLVELALTH
ncbi:MAG: hypothetical protein ABI587_13175 [Gemmatimonadales bacterium]